MELARSEVTRLRALITECLPFELPFEASTHWLYDWLEEHALDVNKRRIKVLAKSRKDILLLALIGGDKSNKLPAHASAEAPRMARIQAATVSGAWHAPARFVVRRDQLRNRSLDLLSLGSQIAVAYIYANFKDSLLYYGSRARSSLRHPSRVNQHGRMLGSGTVVGPSEQNRYVETSGRKLNTYNSFFAYEKYAFIGQFYDSPRWHALEARWTYLRRLDVSNCFASIYTHSFTWSTGTDLHSKSHLGKSPDFHRLDLGRAFDKVMQNSNWGETHGICVGPEASRIFAEIIFQKIDLEIEDRVSAANIDRKSYEFLRYVDDYFVYSNSKSTLEAVSRVLESVLADHSFALNATKTMDYVTPFTTEISLKKANLKAFLKQSLPRKDRLPRFDAREVGVQLKSLLLDADNDAAAAGSSLSLVEREVKRFVKKRARKCSDLQSARELTRYTWGYVHGMLHQYLSHPSATSAIKVVRTLRYYWNMAESFTGVSDADRRLLHYESTERLHFAISKAITRLIEASGTEIEICHFLSLASACDLDLASIEEIAGGVLKKLEAELDSLRTPKSNQALLFLLLSSLKYFLPSERVSPSTRSALLDFTLRLSMRLLSKDFIPAASVRSQASQEYFVLAVLECKFLTPDERFQLLAQPWLLELIKQEVALPEGTDTKYAKRFLRRCLADHEREDLNLSAFEWGAADFDRILYEKEPQFIY